VLTIRHGLWGLAAAFLSILSNPAHAAWTETNIFTFTSEGTSYAGLARDDAGNLYGTAGNNVFKLSPPAAPNAAWTETILYTFTGGLDGTLPNTTPVIDKAGNLYGTTIYGNSVSPGTAYRLSPPAPGGTQWTKTTIHRFTGDESYGPYEGLSIDGAGNLYGMAWVGFPVEDGHVFRLKAPVLANGTWIETIIANVKMPFGEAPHAALTLDPQGNLYGAEGRTHEACAIGDCGTIFRLAPPVSGKRLWTKTVLYAFKGRTDGINPQSGLVIGKYGAIYGATAAGGIPSCLGSAGPQGCGTVFKLTPTGKVNGLWTETVIHRFSSRNAYPAGGLAIDKGGNLYGSQAIPFSQKGAAAIYQLARPTAENTSWTETKLNIFYHSRTSHFLSPPLLDPTGNVYGTADGWKDVERSVFKLTKPHL
jgi:uncharacterized repeat protein (TIGR03803 family)